MRLDSVLKQQCGDAVPALAILYPDRIRLPVAIAPGCIVLQASSLYHLSDGGSYYIFSLSYPAGLAPGARARSRHWAVDARNATRNTKGSEHPRRESEPF